MNNQDRVKELETALQKALIALEAGFVHDATESMTKTELDAYIQRKTTLQREAIRNIRGVLNA